MSPQILISYATSETLGILKCKIPNVVAQSHLDVVTLPRSPSQGGLRKTIKHVTFQDPFETQPHCTSPPCSIRKTMKMVQFRIPISDTKPQSPSLPSSTQPNSALNPHKPSLPFLSISTPPRSALKPHTPSQAKAATPPTAMSQDSVAHSSFDTIGNMPSTYTIRTNPSVSLSPTCP